MSVSAWPSTRRRSNERDVQLAVRDFIVIKAVVYRAIGDAMATWTARIKLMSLTVMCAGKMQFTVAKDAAWARSTFATECRTARMGKMREIAVSCFGLEGC